MKNANSMRFHSSVLEEKLLGGNENQLFFHFDGN